MKYPLRFPPRARPNGRLPKSGLKEHFHLFYHFIVGAGDVQQCEYELRAARGSRDEPWPMPTEATALEPWAP